MYIFFKHPILLDVFSVYKQILVDHNSFTFKKKKNYYNYSRIRLHGQNEFGHMAHIYMKMLFWKSITFLFVFKEKTKNKRQVEIKRQGNNERLSKKVRHSHPKYYNEKVQKQNE